MSGSCSHQLRVVAGCHCRCHWNWHVGIVTVIVESSRRHLGMVTCHHSRSRHRRVRRHFLLPGGQRQLPGLFWSADSAYLFALRPLAVSSATTTSLHQEKYIIKKNMMGPIIIQHLRPYR
jgi:hypothetical protein